MQVWLQSSGGSVEPVGFTSGCGSWRTSFFTPRGGVAGIPAEKSKCAPTAPTTFFEDGGERIRHARSLRRGGRCAGRQDAAAANERRRPYRSGCGRLPPSGSDWQRTQGLPHARRVVSPLNAVWQAGAGPVWRAHARAASESPWPSRVAAVDAQRRGCHRQVSPRKPRRRQEDGRASRASRPADCRMRGARNLEPERSPKGAAGLRRHPLPPEQPPSSE